MKQVSASEARRNWFRLLDEVAAGEVVVVQREGHRIVLRCEPVSTEIPSYAGLLEAVDPDQADTWHWEWGPDGTTFREQ